MKRQLSRIVFLCISLLVTYTGAFAQLQVSKESHHQPVIVNDYIRLLDVWIDPGDTTKFHVHSTPSFSVYLTSTNISTQLKSESWIPDKSETGKTWYKTFKPDILFHRICNTDTTAFHTIDIELLKSYDSKLAIATSPLPYPLFLNNEKAFVYKLDHTLVDGMDIIGRGPIVAVLVSGGPVSAENLFVGEASEIKAGQFMYMDPGASYHFTCKDKGPLNMILFELK